MWTLPITTPKAKAPTSIIQPIPKRRPLAEGYPEQPAKACLAGAIVLLTAGGQGSVEIIRRTGKGKICTIGRHIDGFYNPVRRHSTEAGQVHGFFFADLNANAVNSLPLCGPMRPLMRAVAALIALLWSCPILAQTTTFTTDCASSVAVSGGGLTLTKNGTASYGACRATVPKYSGLWYFEVTIGATPHDFSVGFATGSNINGGYSLTEGDLGPSVGYTSVGALSMANGKIYWAGVHNSGTSCPFVSGKTTGIALNLNTDNPQIWVTCDVTGTSGFGGGPLWNNDPCSPSCTISPTQAGSLIPNTDGTGHITGTAQGPFLPGYGYYPAFASLQSDVVTFNFGATSFVGTVPSGYSSWNTVGGAAPVPGPTSPMTINVANAPGYQTSHAYATGSRVVAGPGWNGSSYTSGSALYLWALSGAGGTSGGSQPAGLNSCATPTGVGGGFNGTPPAGWSGATSVSDNGLTWVCLTKVDYTTLTGAVLDDSHTWVAGAPYSLQQTVIDAGQAYTACGNASGSCGGWGATTVNAGTTAPHTLGSAIGTSYFDGAINWTAMGPVVYSSRANQWNHQIQWFSNNSLAEVQHNYAVNINIWYGGVAQQVYLAGSNGEGLPILAWHHGDVVGHTAQNCMGAWNVLRFDLSAHGEVSCFGYQYSIPYVVAPASGDGFEDNATPGATPLRMDSTKGVTLENTASSLSGNQYGTLGEPVAWSDSGGEIKGLQFLSTNGMCVSGVINGPGSGFTVNIHVDHDIFDCGGSYGAIAFNSSPTVNDNVIIARSTMSGAFGIYCRWACPVFNNTAIGANATNGSFLQVYSPGTGFYEASGPYFPVPYYNNVFVGFPVPWAVESSAVSSWTTLAGNNATDQTSGKSGTFTGNYLGIVYTILDFPGVGNICGPPGNGSTCFGLTPSNEFVASNLAAPPDLRIKSTSADIYGAGAKFSFATGGSMLGTLVPTPDIYGQPIPTSGRYDVGAAQFNGSPPPVVAGPSRMWR